MGRRWGRAESFMVSPLRHPKTGVYWYRQAVPKGLQAAVAEVLGRPGKRHLELKWTLGTKDAAEAKRRWPGALQKAQGIFDAARSGARPLAPEQLYALAGVWYQRQLDLWAHDRSAWDSWAGWGEMLAADDAPPALPTMYADDLLASEGVVTDPDSRLRLSELLAMRLLRALMRQDQLDGGDYSRDPLLKTFPAWTPPSVKSAVLKQEVGLTALVDRWKAVAAVKPRTAEEAAYAVGALVAFLDHDDAAKLTRADLQRWRDQMKEAGRSNVTWNNRLSLIRQPLLFGVAEGLLPGDVTENLRLPKRRSRSPLPFTDAEAVKILLAARLEKRASIRWAPWLMAFSGMRVAEVLQLTRGDVRQEDGIWYLSVNEDDASKSVKTSQQRSVPLHTAVIAEGFLAYVDTIAGDGPLFPDKRVDGHGNRGGRAWNVVGRWVRKTVGITDTLKAPDHSWRHRVEDELRAAAVGEDVRDAVLGHARKTTGRVYGVRGEALKRLAEAVGRIPVPTGLTGGGR